MISPPQQEYELGEERCERIALRLNEGSLLVTVQVQGGVVPADHRRAQHLKGFRVRCGHGLGRGKHGWDGHVPNITFQSFSDVVEIRSIHARIAVGDRQQEAGIAAPQKNLLRAQGETH